MERCQPKPCQSLPPRLPRLAKGCHERARKHPLRTAKRQARLVFRTTRDAFCDETASGAERFDAGCQQQVISRNGERPVEAGLTERRLKLRQV